jgi:hypothetical protein
MVSAWPHLHRATGSTIDQDLMDVTVLPLELANKLGGGPYR